MSTSQEAPVSAEKLFERLARDLRSRPLVEPGTGFGSMPGLRVRTKIFAMLCRGELVVKLPQARVDSLVAAGVATRFDARRDGRRMKQWAAISREHASTWSGLAAEALHHVSRSS